MKSLLNQLTGVGVAMGHDTATPDDDDAEAGDRADTQPVDAQWSSARTGTRRGGMNLHRLRERIRAATKLQPKHRLLLSPGGKYLVSLAVALLWASVSAWIARSWAADIGAYVTPVGGWIAIALVALIPGFVVALMGMSLVLDRQSPLRLQNPDVAITIIIAARNEEAGIGETIKRVTRHHYSGSVQIIVADNNSTDRTVEVAIETAERLGVDILIVRESTVGKSFVLNAALQQVTTPYVMTVDADTLLHPEALRRVTSRILTDPAHVVAVAGSVLVANAGTNLLTKMREWDYWIGIAAVKRMQSMYSATLVAQGAFSVYETADVREVGGSPDAIGEDIVLTWLLMKQGSRVLFEPTAVAFTNVPERVHDFARQRSRWARGMLEGIHTVPPWKPFRLGNRSALETVPPWKQSRPLAKAVGCVDLLILWLDIGYVLMWLPRADPLQAGARTGTSPDAGRRFLTAHR